VAVIRHSKTTMYLVAAINGNRRVRSYVKGFFGESQREAAVSMAKTLNSPVSPVAVYRRVEEEDLVWDGEAELTKKPGGSK